MENNSELNNRAAQYTLCFNAQCSKAESCLRHSMTQYNTAQNARLSVINPLCYPAAGKECPHFRTNKRYGWHGASKPFTTICLHAFLMPSTSIWKLSSDILPITGIAIRSWDSLRNNRNVSAKYAKSMVGMRRLYSIGYRRVRVVNVSAGTPAKVSTEISQGEFDGQRLVQEIPPVGTVYTLLWYTSYHGEVQTIPN